MSDTESPAKASRSDRRQQEADSGQIRAPLDAGNERQAMRSRRAARSAIGQPPKRTRWTDFVVACRIALVASRRAIAAKLAARPCAKSSTQLRALAMAHRRASR